MGDVWGGGCFTVAAVHGIPYQQHTGQEIFKMSMLQIPLIEQQPKCICICHSTA